MSRLWYRDAIIYQVDPSLYRDADGDGMGDLQGITQRLPYLRGLGVTCLWLMPFYCSPFKDGGYDVTDHMAVDPRFGTLADMVDLLEAADELGIRVLIDLVAQHTSDQHPWFQAACQDRNSPYRDYFIWADTPEPTEVKPIFPTVEDSVWAWNETAGQYYRHTFYRHEPDLNLSNPEVRHEVFQIMSFWLRMGVAGFRVDAASHMIERAKAADPREGGFWLMSDLQKYVQMRRPDAVLFGEVDVPPEQYSDYFGEGDRLGMVSNFWMNNHLYLALARGAAEPLARALQEQPVPPHGGQYVTWVRNHDELDLERLSEAERDEVMRRFAPDHDMRIYDRGIRRRLPPMLDGNRDWIAVVHAILLSLPGTPILRYGEEIGMGDDLSLPERLAVRTAMQWSDEPNAGFSMVAPQDLRVPVIQKGDYRYELINVFAQLQDDQSLLARTGKMLRARLSLYQISAGAYRILEADCPSVLALEYRMEGSDEVVITVANLGSTEVNVALADVHPDVLIDVLSDGPYERHRGGAAKLALRGYGYRWLRHREAIRETSHRRGQ